MNDPYGVLGIPPTASEDDIRQAYCDLARKYDAKNFPDKELADMAAGKMNEINDAYDTIMTERGASQPQDEPEPARRTEERQERYSAPTHPEYPEIRRVIADGKLDEAEWMLSGIENRDAEWYFLRGGIFYKRGWLDEAKRNLRQAIAMEPENVEYRQAFNKLDSGKTAYRSEGRKYNGQNAGVTPCDCCAGLMCADCCCRCTDCC